MSSSSDRRRIDAFARHLAVTGDRLRGRARDATSIRKRRIVICALHELGWSYSRIGRAMGHRDHSTVLHHHRRATAADRAEAEALLDAPFRQVMDGRKPGRELLALVVAVRAWVADEAGARERLQKAWESLPEVVREEIAA